MPGKNKPQLDHSDDATFTGARKKRSEATQVFVIILIATLIIGAIIAVVCFTFDVSLAGWITIGVMGGVIIGDLIYLIYVFIKTKEGVKQDYYASSLRIEKYIEENKKNEEEAEKKNTIPRA